MNRLQLRTLFLDTLNRDDCTPALADQFMGLGLRRVERILRVPFQKNTVETLVDDDWPGFALVPNDYLAMIWLKVNGRTIARTSGTGGSRDALYGDPSVFFLEREKISFRPLLKTGDVISIHYYREAEEPMADNEANELTSVVPDLVTYASLVFAAVHFSDERHDQFKGLYGELLGEVQSMSDADEMSGGLVIRNPYEGIV